VVKNRPVKERVIEQQLVAGVQALGGVCLKVGIIGRRGFFDRICVLPGGRVLFVELKRPRGSRITPHQQQYIELFKTLGVDCCVVKNADDIARLLPGA
jgi:hypothetical protein